jgi:hypothetical protein
MRAFVIMGVFQHLQLLIIWSDLPRFLVYRESRALGVGGVLILIGVSFTSCVYTRSEAPPGC